MTKQQKRDWAGIAVLITAIVGALGFVATTIDRYVFDKPAQADEQAVKLGADEGAFDYLSHKVRRLERRVAELERRQAPTAHVLAMEEKAAAPAEPEKTYRDFLHAVRASRTGQAEVNAEAAAPGE